MKVRILFAAMAIFTLLLPVCAQQDIPQWECFEKALTLHTDKNPFTDVVLTATFIHEDSGTQFTVEGFYDGNDTFRLRFMPTKQGKWIFKTHATEKELDGIEGALRCTAPLVKGMVGTKGQDFVYPDGTRYNPLGTTSYAWIHAPEKIQEQTYQSMEKSGFNKLRFCVFPNNSVYELPTLYPYQLVDKQKDANGKDLYIWDYSRFVPAFFKHLEQCVERLRNLDIEADVILFTPYDNGVWGFDRMTMENNFRYLRYVVARLSAYSNVWWSVANEWNLVKAKTHDQWITLSKFIAAHDPYHHLLSIHGGTAVYIDYNLPFYTHASIQDQGPLYNFEGAATVRNMIHKPVVFDEVCYEGDHSSRWAQMTGEEMLERIWTGLIGGTYVTHGECYVKNMHNETDYTGYAYLAIGGDFQGTCPTRIPFTRRIIDALPFSIRLADQSWDPITACAGPDDYLIYFGSQRPKKWVFNLPTKCSQWPRLTEGVQFEVEIIDTWNMTSETCKGVFETKKADNRYRLVEKNGKSVKLPGKPYILLHLKKVKK